MKNNRIENRLLLGLVVVLLVLYGINLLLVDSALSPLKTSLLENKPANLHLTLISTACNDCYDMDTVIRFIKTQNVKVIQEKNLTYTHPDAQKLISDYGITTLPTLIITGEIEQANIKSLWERLGVRPIDGAVVLTNVPPYYHLGTQKVVGLVDVIKITDNSCAECYDVENHMAILANYGVFVNKSLIYDVSSSNGKTFLNKYNITKVPTIVLPPDFSVYSLASVWEQVGTIESDGWYVFRSAELMGTYKDLGLNKTINATQ